MTAAIALVGLGHEGVTVVRQALTNQDFRLCHSAATALGEAQSDLDAVIPALIEVARMKCSKQEDYLVRGAAGSSLVELHAKPELVVPVFLVFLTDPDAGTRRWGASLLAGFGADAKAAVPELLNARSDADADVREMAAIALKEIDPRAAAPSQP